MEIDYTEIGKRIAQRRKELGLKQFQLSEMIGVSTPYMSNIERATSIPSTEVIMRLALALETTPDAFLVGTARHQEESWRDVAELLRPMNHRQLRAAQRFLSWLAEEEF